MTPEFQALMRDATRLTQAGDLMAATAAIQAALGGAAASATPSNGDVIDVEARERPAPAPALQAPVIMPPDPPLKTTTPDHAEAFVAGHYRGTGSSRDYKLYRP